MNIDLSPIIANAEKACAAAEGDYIQDGILFCGTCHTAKQTSVYLGGKERILPCMCKCAVKKYEEERQAEKARQRMQQVKELRTNGIHDSNLRCCTFAADNGANPEIMSRAQRYTEKWQQMRDNNMGLLLWGNTGNGKTFTAACIANALIDRCVPVLMTSFAKIINAVTGLYSDDRIIFMRGLNEFDLLVIDDLGAERQSEFALEQVYNVIDQRYKAGKPMIITTNLTMKELKNPPNMDYQRIYDRVLEMCIPMHFSGESLRKQQAVSKRAAMKELFDRI